MRVNLITALSSHQVEDQVIEVLLRHDFQLQRRLLSPLDFDTELIASPSTVRTLIITDKDFGANWREIKILEEDSSVMKESLNNFNLLLQEHNQQCIFPEWN